MKSATKIAPRKIHVDNFEVTGKVINAFTLIDGKDIDFSINKSDFEKFCDKHDMREWGNSVYNPYTEDFDEDEGVTEWPDIYGQYDTMTKFLSIYIQDCYLQDAIDIQTPINKILKTAWSMLKTFADKSYPGVVFNTDSDCAKDCDGNEYYEATGINPDGTEVNVYVYFGYGKSGWETIDIIEFIPA